jgi:DNA-binding IclR family transcriptional regulator
VAANGKAVMAELDDELVAQLAASELPRASSGIRSLAEFLTEIEGVRALDYALDLDEHSDGISAAGVAFGDPLRNF